MKAKGKRPGFAPDPNVDRLTAMVMALAGEVWVLRERLDTMERLTGQSAAVESYVADERVAAAREADRAAFLDRVLAIVSASQQEAAAGESPATYQAVVDALAEDAR
ncbi:MAG: hypothetical protein RIM84_14145 [Alphaproteobacteria bacterium]